MIPNGHHRARAVGAELGRSPKKGTEQIVVEFQLLDGELAGERINWIGYFTPNTSDRTLEALRICGWKTDDVTDLDGLTDNEVSLAIEQETYQDKTHAKVQFVNRLGSGFKMKSPMNDAEKKAFAAKMRGLAVKSRSVPKQDGVPSSQGDDKLPF
jgi:hypothetical protein